MYSTEENLKKRKKKLVKLSGNSYSPYSNFKVCASIKTTCDNEFNGVNIENSSFSMTLCAEASAIGCMITELGPDAKIADILIINDKNSLCPPCGACRQRLEEFSTSNTKVVLYTSENDKFIEYSLNDLLPTKFCSKSFSKR